MRQLLSFAMLVLSLMAPGAYADDWGAIANISATLGVNDSRLCIGEGSRGDLGCPTYAPSLTTTGDVELTGGLTTGNISLTTVSTTWGYIRSTGYSYIPNLSTGAISATSILINGQPITGGASPTNVPAFSAHKNGVNQTVAASTWTKLTLGTEDFDTYNNFNTATSRFTPTIAGYYMVIGKVYCSASTGCYAGIYKNGTFIHHSGTGAADEIVANASTVVYMNGSTDYLELYGLTGGTVIGGATPATGFQATLIASGNGLVSGTGGATALSGLTDVTIASPVSGSVLTYNAATSKWVNAPLSNVMSTTTMVSNWPDALTCVDTGGTPAPTGRQSIFWQFYRDGSNGSMNYAWVADSVTYSIQFNSDGTYSSKYNSGSQTDTSDCEGQTIAQLYAAGKAFNFIGNSAAGSGTALGDRLTSGTLAVTANSATSVISLTTAGTTWGYLGSAASYLPNLSTNALTVGGFTLTSSSLVSSSAQVAFSVHKNGTDQTVTASTWTKMTWNTEVFDTNNNFASDRFTPTVAGKYHLTTSVYCSNATTICNVGIYKNGVLAVYGFGRGANTIGLANAVLDMNGTTDYVEVYANNGAATTISGAIINTFFSGYLINGGSGGSGGATALSALTDVNVTTPTSGTVLTYNGGTSKWEAMAATGGLGYAITSGTTSVTVNSATSIISLTTTGTTWGYLGSTGSYLPRLNTLMVSSTNISATSLTVNGVAVTGLMSPTNVPAFRVNKNGVDQTITASTWTKLTFSTEELDTYGNFNTGTSRFTPTVAGTYIFTGNVSCASTSAACYAGVYKNGNILNYSGDSGASQRVAMATSIVTMNGTTDYVELWGFSGSTTISAGTTYGTNFQGSLLASGNGLVSGTGGGATALSGLTDVTLASPATGQVLTYNGTNWVNATPSSTNVISGTTTMVEGWPDGIMCRDGSSNTYILYYNNNNSTDVAYHMASSSGASAQYIVFTKSTGAYMGHASLAGFDCVTSAKSISTLYAEGRAFNFIGNSGSGGSALGDRLTSGTLAVTANSTTSVISLTTAGTTWGYLGSTASYLPRLNTLMVSSTNISATSLTVNGVAVTGNISPTNVPAFRAHRNAASQTVSANNWTKITLTTEEFDTYNNFDTTASRFTPTVAGYYLTIGQVYCFSASICYSSIYKNGVAVAQGGGYDTSGDPLRLFAPATYLTYMNGTTDYLELYVYPDVTSISGATAGTFLQSTLIASGNGLVSGTGATTLSALTDVNVTTPTSGTVLTYNGGTSKWEAMAATGGLGYAITSGTTSVTVNSTTSVISLTTVSTTWGYLGSTASYIPNLSTNVLNGVSASSYVTATNATLGSVLQYNGIRWNAVSPSSLISGSQVAFSVHKNSTNQTVTTNTWTKLTWPTEVYDTNNNFASDRFTPTIPGYYFVTLTVECNSATSFCFAAIYKNGTLFRSVYNRTTVSGIGASVNEVMYFNGSTDYIEAYGRNNGGTAITGAPDLTWFSGVLVNGVGAGSGGGATALSGLTDVTLASPVSESLLTYNGSTWTNTSRVSVSTITLAPAAADSCTTANLGMVKMINGRMSYCRSR